MLCICPCLRRVLGIRYGCNDRYDPDGRAVLIVAIAIVANLIPTEIITIISTSAFTWAIDIILIVAATIAIVAVAIAIVWVDNLGF